MAPKHRNSKKWQRSIEKLHNDPLRRQKLTEARQRRGPPNLKHYPGFVSPDGEVFRDVFNLSAFAREHSLVVSGLSNLASGRLAVYKGWISLGPPSSTTSDDDQPLDRSSEASESPESPPIIPQ